MTLLESVFAGLTVLFVGGLGGVLWRLSGVRRHVDQLQLDLNGVAETEKAVVGLAATVEGQAQLMELARRQNESEHKAIVGQLSVLTEHVLAIRRANGGTR